MKKNQRISVSILFLILSLSFSAQIVNKDYQDGKLWIKVKSSFKGGVFSLEDNLPKLTISTFPFLESLNKKYPIKQISSPFNKAKLETDLKRVYEIEITDIYSIDEVIKVLEKNSNIEYVEKIPLIKTSLVPNDPSFTSQWALNKINATGAWNYFSSGSSIIVAVIDDAIETTHSDLAPSLWINQAEIPTNGIDDDNNGYIDDINGWDMADNDNNPNPTTSAYLHGTHVAGIVGASSNNNLGIASIGYSVKLMCIKASNAPATVNYGYSGILYATDNGAKVINMSWGSYVNSQTGQTIIDYAHNAGVVLVAAAGNDNTSAAHYPSDYNHVISVAATSSNDVKASFSNFGSQIDVSAPGENILSTGVGNTYINLSGTSMASPYVAGLASLMLSLNPYLAPNDIETCIKNNTDNISALNPSYSGSLGTGRINANNTMQCVQSSLAWAPVADFSANTTTISAGGNVTFSNISLYNPTTYTWSFSGGTPASSNLANPPSITYNTPGTYSVSLSVANSNGTNTKTQLAYIVVNPAASCTKINYPAPSGWTGVNYSIASQTGGWVNGVNQYNDKQKAMFFDASSQTGTILQNVLIAFGRASSGTPSKIVPVNIYDGSSGTPGALLGTSYTTMAQIISDKSNNVYTQINFVNTPVTLPSSKKFFVSVDLSNLSWSASPKDTLSILSNANGQTVPTAIWDQKSTNLWQQYNTAGSYALNASLYMHPYLTNQPTVATFTQTAMSICQGQYITYNPTGSTTQNGMAWSIQGASSIGTNTLQPQVLYNTPGTFTTQLIVNGGGCALQDTAKSIITVNAKPVISISSASTTICNGNSLALNGSGALSYTWSPSTFLNSTSSATVITTPTANITYNLSGSGSNGCVSNSSIQLQIESQPIVSVTSTNSLICSGQSISFDASLSSGVNTYSWSAVGASPATSNLISPTFTYNSSGTYTVSLMASNNCFTNNAYTKLVSVGCTDISSSTINHFYVTYNSSANSILLHNNIVNFPTKITLYDLLGKTILNDLIPESSKEFFLPSNINTGIYFIQISNNISDHTSKVFINKN